MAEKPSYRLSDQDRQILDGFTEIDRPEPEQLFPLPALEDLQPKEPASGSRLAKTRDRASQVLDKIDELTQEVDRRCARFKVDGEQDKGSDLFKAMVRVFDQRTTTVTYDHYKRALQYREQLAKEDAANLRLT